MSKQIQVNLAFNADTAKAKQQINELVNSLNQISNKNTQIFDDREFREAANAAKDLTKHLEAAVNVNTGKLDLNKFSQSLSQSKQSLSDLYNSLSKAGPQGQQAFLQLASSIASSESQVLNLNAKVKDLGVTLKNTVKWQLSSSLVHGFMGALQHAFGYAQDLNSSLNDIRIVTGASAEEMAKFAEQANKSAKALSSTTNEYAKASLIYYQQGLSDSEVQERTDITIKMANVSKESAQTVSDQMTAVWNNFYDGSKSLEYYADVMTALGAATASSVDEIAGGLEKFAAIGDTIGLSYEYAAAALATITSNTRESEEVVGTALKTIFARIQGLSLGETLDDGTTLNKYSQALEKVGISIFDQAGELKAMDNILAELGSKWQTLSKDQQTALAQTVAGVRQYTQLVALMDNWDSGDSDSFMANLNTAYNSEGALQEQQDIYAKSWEAAADRVTAATEDIYDSLINDEVIVVLLNGLEKVLNVVGALVDGFGGLKGILLLVAGIFSRQIANEIPEAIGKLKNNFDILTGSAQKKKVADIDKSKEIIQTNLDTGKVYKTEGDRIRAQSTLEELSALSQLEKIRSQLTDTQQENINKKIAERKASQQLIASIQDEIDAVEKAFKQSKRKIQTKQNKQTVQQKIESYGGNEEEWKKRQENTEKLKNKKQRQLSQNDLDYIEETEKFEQKRKELQDSVTEVGLKVDQTVAQALDEQITKLQQLYKQQAQLNQLSEDFDSQLSKWSADGKNLKLIEDPEKQQQAFKEIQQSMKNYAKQLQEIDNLKISPKALEEFNKKIDNIGKNVNSVEDMEKAIQDMIQEFDKIESTDDNFKNLRSQIENVSSSIQMLENDIEGVEDALKALDPSLFKELQQAAEQAGTSVGELYYTLSKQKNAQDLLPKIDTSIPEMEFSTALTKVGAMGMDIMALFAELGSAITVCFDEGATAGEKFVAVLSTIPAAAMTIADIIGGLADMPKALEVLQKGFEKLPILIGGAGTSIGGFFAGISGKATAATVGVKGLGTAFAWLSGTLGPVGAGIAIVAAALVALFGLFKLGESIYNNWAANDPGKQFEAAKEATSAMTTAANEANTAYQNLLNTINGYNSAVSALEGLEVGTQEFINALITANEKAWELIDTYGLIQGQDWEYGKNGEIIIKHSAQDRITKEASNIREDAIIAQSATEIQEKQAEYNTAKNEAGYFGSNLTEDVRQNLYKALGIDTDSSKQLEKDWYAAETEEAENAIIEEVGRKLHGEKWDSSNSEMVDFIRSALFNMDKISNMFDAYTKYNTAKKNQLDKQISTVMSDEKAYQKTSWKEVINELLGQQKQEAIDEATKKLDAGTDEQVKKDYEDYLKQTYIEEDGKYYRKDASGKKTGEAVEGLTELTVEQQKNILAEIEALKTLEQQGIDVSEGFNKIANNMTKSQKDVADALMNTDLSKLTDEQIKAFENGELSFKEAIGSSNYEQLSKLLGEDFINKLEEGLKKAVEDYKPEEFNLDTWKKNYAAKMDAIGEIDEYGRIDAENYALLTDEYSQYFNVQNDGSAILTMKAEEFKTIVEGIELGKLKDEINSLKEQSQSGAEAYGEVVGRENVTVDFVTQMANQMADSVAKDNAETWVGTQAEKGMMAATGISESDLASYSTAEERINALTAAWFRLQDTLNQVQQTTANTAKSIQELDDMLNKGEIDIEEYNEAFDSTIAKEAELNDLDYDSILDFARYLQSTNEELKNNEKLCKRIALSYHRWDKGVKSISDNFDDWKKNIKDANKNSKTYINTINSMKDAFKDVFSEVDPKIIEQLSDEFLTNKDNLKLLEQGLNGNEQAWNDWETAVLQEINKINPAFANVSAEMKAQMNDLVMAAANLDFSGLTPGASIDDTDFNAKLNAMVFNTAEAAQAMCDNLSSVGVDAEIEEHTYTVPPNTNLTQQNGAYVITPPNSEPITIPISASYTESDQGKTYKWYTIKGAKYNGKGVTAGGGGYNKPSGGGGGGSKKEPKYAEKKSSSEKTRYHTLQNQLEDLTAEYDALADASDRAFGQDKLDAIDAEIKKTDELIDKQEEYLQAIQSDLPVDKSVMTAYYNDTIGGPAMQFDENGNISNYDQIQDAMFNKYNAMTAYDEESLEWQTFEKKYEQLEKYIEQYEETYDLLREEEANYQDLLNQRIDLELEKVEYKVEIQLEVPENQKEVIEYQLGRIEDDAKKTGEALALLTEQAEMTYDQILINKQGLNDALELSLSAAEITEVMAGNMDVLNGKTFTEDQISAIQDYKDNLLELNEEFDDIRESIEETVLEAFDMWHEKLEEGIEKFDYFGTILESYQSIIDTVGKDTLGISDSLMNTLSQASVDNAINGVEATRDAYKALQQAQIDAERELEKAKARGDEQSISFWESTLNEIQQNAEDAHEEMLSSWEEALSKIVEQFEASIQTAVDAFNEAVYQLGGIEALSEEFDRQKEMADMYLDDYQKIYELSKLNRDVNNSIDDTDSLAGKQKLKKLLGEINKLQADGVKMSEYDLEYLQAEYDLRLAEIALEEAQRAKDVVRLSRDNEGNWSYVYTQNTEAVDEAQQKYEDALYAMQDLSSNYIDEISAQLIETSKEMQEALAAIRIEDYASIEEYYEEVERVQEQYQEQLALQEEELNKAVTNNKELYDTDWTNYHNAVGYKISDTEEFATKFSDTLLGTLMNSESDTSNFTNILADATSTLMNELYGAAEQYYINMAAAMEAAGTTTGTFADDLATNVNQIKQDSEEAATAVEDMATHMQEQMDNIINKVGEWQRTYGEAMNEIINANLKVIDSFNEMLATLSMDDSTVTVKYDIQNHNSDVLDAERFATGGYTGSWGNTGRLGILDEKELILNKDDTENFIEALKISRSMLNTIELNARQASLGLGTLIPTTVKDDIKETLEQVVQITAEFPNATDHNEIEEAFNMLINRASQFANRK